MLLNFWRIIGIGVAIMLLFSACLILGIAYMGIDDPYARVLTGKALSLFALSIFGQSEALKIYLFNHRGNEISLFGKLNQIGAALAVFFALLLMSKIYSIEALNAEVIGSATDRTTILSSIKYYIETLKQHSELSSLIPLFYFAFINLLLWVSKEDASEIGRVCFLVSDVPVLLPMTAAIILISLIGGYGSHDYKLLVAGATIMLIFTSIILTECTKGLLHAHPNE